MSAGMILGAAAIAFAAVFAGLLILCTCRVAASAAARCRHARDQRERGIARDVLLEVAAEGGAAACAPLSLLRSEDIKVEGRLSSGCSHCRTASEA